MNDETRIVRWQTLPDVFDFATNITESAVYPNTLDNETKIVAWNTTEDTWDTNPQPIINANINICQLYCCGL